MIDFKIESNVAITLDSSRTCLNDFDLNFKLEKVTHVPAQFMTGFTQVLSKQDLIALRALITNVLGE